LFISIQLYTTEFDALIKPIDLTEDISAEKINVIYTDSTGYLWLGTLNGLYRWDGQKAIRYKKNKGSENVQVIKPGPNGRLWVGFKDGSLAYTYKRSLIPFNAEYYRNNNSSVSDILFD